jgi:molecular chaperone DnaK
MRKDGELHAEEDKQRKEELETRNEADSAVYRTEKLLKDNADKISANNKSKLEIATNAVKEALKGTEATAIKTASENLTKTWHMVSAELNKAAEKPSSEGSSRARPGNQQGAEDNQENSKKDEEPVIDAEVVEEAHTP